MNSMSNQKFNTDLSAIVLVYHDESGYEYTQPLFDLVDSGTLIDPETDDDLGLVGWR